ncbi:MAG: hypothetical protein AAFY20_18960 [Cyanobacteria bacterium J06639_14]
MKVRTYQNIEAVVDVDITTQDIVVALDELKADLIEGDRKTVMDAINAAYELMDAIEVKHLDTVRAGIKPKIASAFRKIADKFEAIAAEEMESALPQMVDITTFGDSEVRQIEVDVDDSIE